MSEQTNAPGQRVEILSARFETYVKCPYCGATHDTEGWRENTNVFCEYCHKEFRLGAHDESEQSKRNETDGTSDGNSVNPSTIVARQDADASVETEEGGIVMFAGLLPVCKNCLKPEMNCDCDVPFEPLRKAPTQECGMRKALEPYMAALLSAFATAWKDNPPENGFIQTVPFPEIGSLELQIRRVEGGKTAAESLAELRGENERLKSLKPRCCEFFRGGVPICDECIEVFKSLGSITDKDIERHRVFQQEVRNSIVEVGNVTVERDYLRTQLATAQEELRVERERLDWLLSSGAHLAYSLDGEFCWLHRAYDPDGEETGTVAKNLNGVFSDPRAAIDAARERKGGE